METARWSVGGHVRQRSSLSAAADVGFNRQTVLVIQRSDGTELHRRKQLMNYDTDFAGFLSNLQFSLQASPAEPLTPLMRLRYRELHAAVPKSSKSSGFKREKQPLTPLDERTFDPDIFLPMKSVQIFAELEVGGGEQNDEDEVVNDENDRRLSNGSAPSTSASTSNSPPFPSSDSKGNTGSRSQYLLTPSLKSSVSSVGVGPKNSGGKDMDGSLGGDTQGSLGSGRGSSWDPLVCGNTGHQAGSSAGGATATAAMCVTDKSVLGDAGRGGHGDSGGGDHTAGAGNVDDRESIGGRFSGACGSLASPAPGRKSNLFRLKSLLPRESLTSDKGQDGDRDDAASGTCPGRGGGCGGIALKESLDSSSVFGVSTNSSGSARRQHLAVRDKGRDAGEIKGGGGGVGGAGRGRGGDRRTERDAHDTLARKETVPRQRLHGSSSPATAAASASANSARRQRPQPRGQNPLINPKKAVSNIWAPASSAHSTGSSSSKPPQPLLPVPPAVVEAVTPASDRRKPTTKPPTPTSNLPPTGTPKKRKPKIPTRSALATSLTPEKFRKPNIPAQPGLSVSMAGVGDGGKAMPSPCATPKAATAAAGGDKGCGGLVSPKQSANFQPSHSQSRSKSPRPKPSPLPKADESVGEEGEIRTPRVTTVFSWEKNLRKGGGFRTGTGKPSVKGAGFGNAVSPKRGGGGGQAIRAWRHGMKGAVGGRGGGRGGGGGLFGDSGEREDGGWVRGGDGRPSIGTWNKTQNYLQILKELSGKDEEELEWLAVAKNGKGVLKSEKRRESAETEYHRLLCEESMHQAGLKLLQDRRLEVALRAVAGVGNELKRLNEVYEELAGQEYALDAEDDEAEAQAAAAAAASTGERPKEENEAADQAAAAEAVRAVATAAWTRRQEEKVRLTDARAETEAKVGSLLEDVKTAKGKLKAVLKVLREEMSGAAAAGGGGSGGSGGAMGIGNALTTIVGITADVCSAMEHAAPDRATSGLRSLGHAATALKEEIAKTRTGAQAALGRMEKWRQRKEELPEYEKEIAEQERAWFEREKNANEKALKRMRALCPVGVTGLTVAQLEKRAMEAGSLYPRELALRLKENRLLQWTVEHPDDIARSNFLRGEHAHFFTNLDRYDLVELRAVTACLPDKFEVDGDGRKAAWRAGFLQRVQGLVAQERGDTVSGGWDPDAGERRAVKLPALSAEQTRRPEYFYPTRAEFEERLDKLRERVRRVEAKRAKLKEIKEVLLPEAREEYANVLEDTRHPANKELYSAEELRRARDEAKAESERLAREAKRMEADVASAQRALSESPYTLESLRAEQEAIAALLERRAAAAAVENCRLLRIAERRDKEETECEDGKGEGEERREVGAKCLTAEGMAKSEHGADAEDGSDTEKRATEVTRDADVKTTIVGKEEAPELSAPGGEGERVEIEGVFDPEPQLRSRLADKSSSLKFVTAEEEARMRKYELAKAIGASRALAVFEEAEAMIGEESRPPAGDASAAVPTADSTAAPAGRSKDLEMADAGVVDAVLCEDGGGTGNGGARERIKAFGAILEKTLSQSKFPRAPTATLGANAAANGAGTGAGGAQSPRAVSGVVGRRRFLSPNSRETRLPGENLQSPAKAVAKTPPCTPKSKFFKSITDSNKACNMERDRDTTPFSEGQASVAPPVRLGFLDQIRAKAAGTGGGGAEACEMRWPPPPAMGGLLAQIRAKASNLTDGSSSSQEESDNKAVQNTNANGSFALRSTVCESFVGGSASEEAAVEVPPPPVATPLQQVPLFGKSAGGGIGSPPTDFLAEVRAKAAAREVLRRREGHGTS